MTTLSKTFQSAEHACIEDMQNYLHESLANATEYTVCITVNRVVPFYTLLEPWNHETEENSLSHNLLGLYIGMLCITNTKYNNDAYRRLLITNNIIHHGTKPTMNMLRYMLDILTKNESPCAQFPEPATALVFVKDDIQSILSDKTIYRNYFQPDTDLLPKPEPPSAAKAEPEPPSAATLPDRNAVRLRLYGFRIGLPEPAAQKALKRAVKNTSKSAVLSKLAFLIHVYKQRKNTSSLERDYAFVESL